MVKRLIIDDFLKKNVKTYIFGFIALICANLCLVRIPQVLGSVIDALTDKTMTREQVFARIGLMLLLGVAVFVLTFTYRILIIGKSRDLECFLRSRLMEKFQSLPTRFYNENKTGDLMAHVINDLNAIRMSFAIGIVFILEGIIVNVSSILIMVRSINPLLTLIAIVPVFTSLFLIIKLRKAIRRRYRRVQDAFADLSGKIQENISGIRVVKAYVQEESEIKKLTEASQKRMDVQMDYVKLSAFLSPAAQIAFAIAFSIELTVGGIFVVEGRISLGDFVAFNTYLGMLIRPVMLIGRIVEIWQQSFASMGRLDMVFTARTDITDKEADFDIQELNGHIKIDGLSFKYPNTSTYVLKNISVDIPPGKSVGIIGKTGSGKTTIANLIMRLYQVDRGKISIDGNDINSVPLSVLRGALSYSPQDNFLFADTIAQNIKFFDKSIDDESVFEASRLACVYDNIIEFPDKFETLIGERGITLSGGQKQRVSLSRVFAKNTGILILDDSFSAVDANTEEKILRHIRETQQNKTVIYIAHRISTIAGCDEILYLDNGEITERGTHDELLALRGEYYRLNIIQAMEQTFVENE